jgi:hypothetical protein
LCRCLVDRVVFDTSVCCCDTWRVSLVAVVRPVTVTRFSPCRTELEDLKRLVGGRSSVAKEQVYPKFYSMAAFWIQLQVHSRPSLSFSRVHHCGVWRMCVCVCVCVCVCLSVCLSVCLCLCLCVCVMTSSETTVCSVKRRVCVRVCVSACVCMALCV